LIFQGLSPFDIFKIERIAGKFVIKHWTVLREILMKGKWEKSVYFNFMRLNRYVNASILDYKIKIALVILLYLQEERLAPG